MNAHLPPRFFAITFLWSWLIWSPLVLAGLGVLRLDEGPWSIIVMPVAYLGAFGPAVGACYSVWTLRGRTALIDFTEVLFVLEVRMESLGRDLRRRCSRQCLRLVRAGAARCRR